MTTIPMIADLPVNDRPRERMIRRGAKALSDAEILAVLLGSGAPGKNAIYLAHELLMGEGLHKLLRSGYPELVRVRGIGPVKALRIAAAFELGRRLVEREEKERPIYEPDDVARKLIRRFEDAQQEQVGAYYINSRQQILREHDIYRGTVQSACGSPRDIVRHALRENATGVVVYHNHPSGDPTPSIQDKQFTRQLVEALKLVEINLVAHLIIGRNRYYELLPENL
jgi:DNA repair protein RadC